jgi:ribonuclease HI
MGVVAVKEGDGENIHKTAKTFEESEYVDRTTHNVVEYEAVIYSLEYIRKEYDGETHTVFDIHTNSKTVIGEPQDDKMATLSRHMNRSRGGIYTKISHIREEESTYMVMANELAREAAKGASGVE